MKDKPSHPLSESQLRHDIAEQRALAAAAAKKLRQLRAAAERKRRAREALLERRRLEEEARAERKRLEEEARALLERQALEAKAEQERKERQAAIQRNIDRLVGPALTLERVRYLSENACRPKRPLPKPTPVVEPTKLDPPYEKAA